MKQEPQAKDKIERIFGQEQNSEYMGAASFSDARILLFPVRSLVGVFAYITCPMVLERFRRDLAIAGISGNLSTISIPQGTVLGTDTNQNKTQNNKVVLEEFVFNFIPQGTVLGTDTNQNKTQNNKVVLEEFVFNFQADDKVKNLAKCLTTNAIPSGNEYTFWRSCLETHLLVVPDDDFKDFVKFSTEIQPRVKLGDGKSSDTSKGGNLFYQENLPSDSLMYSLVMTQDVFEKIKTADSKEWGSHQDVNEFLKKLDSKRLQIGGDESIGKGIMCVKFYENTSAEKGGSK
ncbi:MAG: type III-B CRISPR module RAMP protein Cmr4 [Chloroherpetonaceae bacterium]|nr:type III-B CRISPR module RAMP protein Cmr4 [Chloroherpetonaceae bacterium]